MFSFFLFLIHHICTYFVCMFLIQKKRSTNLANLWRYKMCGWWLEYMLGNDVNVKVDFLSKFVTGKISGHNSNCNLKCLNLFYHTHM